MRKYLFIFLLVLASAVFPLTAQAGLFSSSCDFMPEEPRPDWVDKSYGLAGYYVGVGITERNRLSVEGLKKSSEHDAISNLMKNIEMSSSVEDEDQSSESSTGKDDNRFRQYVKVSIKVKAAMVLRDLKVKSRWLDRNNCILYTLVAVSKESLEQIRKEELAKARLVKMKELIALGLDRDRNKNVKIRRVHLSDAETLLGGIDFNLLHDELTRDAYVKKITGAISDIDREMEKSKGRTAVAALEHDSSIPSDAVGRILDHVREASKTTDRLMGACPGTDQCIRRAAEEGFSTLALLRVGSQVETTSMGALKGTLTVSITVYDVETRKVIRGPDVESAQTIGWSRDDINWDLAVDKIVQSSRIIADK